MNAWLGTSSWRRGGGGGGGGGGGCISISYSDCKRRTSASRSSITLGSMLCNLAVNAAASAYDKGVIGGEGVCDRILISCLGVFAPLLSFFAGPGLLICIY